MEKVTNNNDQNLNSKRDFDSKDESKKTNTSGDGKFQKNYKQNNKNPRYKGKSNSNNSVDNSKNEIDINIVSKIESENKNDSKSNQAISKNDSNDSVKPFQKSNSFKSTNKYNNNRPSNQLKNDNKDRNIESESDNVESEIKQENKFDKKLDSKFQNKNENKSNSYNQNSSKRDYNSGKYENKKYNNYNKYSPKESENENGEKIISKAIYGARHTAVRILNRYERSDSYLDKLITHELDRTDLIQADKALLTEIVNGVIRWRSKLDWVLTGFYHGEFGKCLNLVKNAMRVALYQILFLDRIPIYSAIDESVEIVKHIQGDKAAGLVNAVLRNIGRNIDNIRYPNENEDRSHYLGVMHSHPKWLVKRWIEQFGEEEAIKLMEYNNQRPGAELRVNNLKASAEEIMLIFEEKNVAYKQSKYLPESIELLSTSINLAQSELFKLGKITIQDASAAFAAKLTNAKSNNVVIDLCAAPGGKTMMLAEMMNNKGKIIAYDKYKVKLENITQSAQRLGFTNITVLEGDGREIISNEKADIILIDAPCTGLGTLAKKPDIKWKREFEDIRGLNEIQKALLENAVKSLKKNGVIVYSTCSIDQDENLAVTKWFLEKFPEFTLDPAEKYIPAELCKDGRMQTFPHIHQMDGAYAVRFQRKS